tara:strand:+ start:26 stop:625 length:600 start_codon:yes stop_codon:yes gene_type:complete
MSITINGNGTVTGLSAGGLPAGSVTSATLADGAAAGSKLGAGSIIQVVHVTKNDISSITTGSSSANYDVPGLTATITPSSTSNKILIDACLNISINNGYHVTARILRGSTYIAFGDGTQSSVIEGYAHRYTRATNGSYSIDQMTLFHEDSPSTTSATTYKIQFNTHTAGTAYINRTNVGQDANYNGTAVSSIRLMEVAA